MSGDPHYILSLLDDYLHWAYPATFRFPSLFPHHYPFPFFIETPMWAASVDDCSSESLVVIHHGKWFSCSFTDRKFLPESDSIWHGWQSRGMGSYSRIWGDRSRHSHSLTKYQHFRGISSVAAPLVFGTGDVAQCCWHLIIVGDRLFDVNLI